MRFRFEPFVLDTEKYELRKDGALLHSEPQVVALIAFLVENADRMVSKDEILERVWHGRVVSDAALSSRIKTARKLLDESGQAQSVIRRDYRRHHRSADQAPLARRDCQKYLLWLQGQGARCRSNSP